MTLPGSSHPHGNETVVRHMSGLSTEPLKVALLEDRTAASGSRSRGAPYLWEGGGARLSGGAAPLHVSV